MIDLLVPGAFVVLGSALLFTLGYLTGQSSAHARRPLSDRMAVGE